ncbi:hypothetical protein CHS0354_020390, partial [Potamilus streckersoni]
MQQKLMRQQILLYLIAVVTSTQSPTTITSNQSPTMNAATIDTVTSALPAVGVSRSVDT